MWAPSNTLMWLGTCGFYDGDEIMDNCTLDSNYCSIALKTWYALKVNIVGNEMTGSIYNSRGKLLLELAPNESNGCPTNDSGSISLKANNATVLFDDFQVSFLP